MIDEEQKQTASTPTMLYHVDLETKAGAGFAAPDSENGNGSSTTAEMKKVEEKDVVAEITTTITSDGHVELQLENLRTWESAQVALEVEEIKEGGENGKRAASSSTE